MKGSGRQDRQRRWRRSWTAKTAGRFLVQCCEPRYLISEHRQAMMGTPQEAAPAEQTPDEPPRTGKDQATLMTVALSLIIAAVAWYLLKEWVTLLRPLFLSIFLCNVIVPTHLWLKQRITGPASIIVLA